MNPPTHLFTLIRLGLNLPTGEPFPVLSEKEWHEIRQLAQKQRIEALCFEGISALTASKRPSMPLCLKWGGCALRTERQVHRLNSVLQDVTSWLQDKNIGFILMKGSAAASRYPNPARRECGDIDLLIRPPHFASACQLLKQKGAVMVDNAPEKHTSFLWQGIVIELHHTLIDCSSPQAVRYIRDMDYCTVSASAIIDDKRYPVLEPAFDCAYMTAHLLHHLWTDGVRLRQICDWMMLVHRHGREINGKEFTAHLRSMQLDKMFPVLLGIGIKHFGLPADRWGQQVTDSDYRLAEKLLQHIFRPESQTNRIKDAHMKTGFPKHCQNLLLYASHIFRFRNLSPAEAFWFLPARIRRFLYKKLCNRQKQAGGSRSI